MNQDTKIKRIKLPASAKMGLLLFVLTGSIILALLPRLDANPLALSVTAPAFSFLLGAGLIMIGLSALLFHYFDQLNLGFSKTALALAFGFNAVVIAIKFVLSPWALYTANRHASFDTQFGDPNEAVYYVITGGTVLLLYMLVFRLMYKYFVRKFHHDRAEDTQKHKTLTSNRVGVLVLIIVALALSGGGLLLIPLLFFGASIQYLTFVIQILGIPILIALLIALTLAYDGFKDVEKQAVSTGNAMLIASFFWLGALLLLAYHVLWVVFMLSLVQLWPFNTYTSK